MSIDRCEASLSFAQCLELHFHLLCHSLELMSVDVDLVECLACIEQRDSIDVDVVMDLGGNVREGNGHVVNSNAPLSI